MYTHASICTAIILCSEASYNYEQTACTNILYLMQAVELNYDAVLLLTLRLHVQIF